MGGAPVDVIGKEIGLSDVLRRHVHRLAGIGAQRGVGAVASLFLIGLGDPEEHPNRSHRDLLTEIGDEVEAPSTNQGIEDARRTRGPCVPARSSSSA